MPNDDPGVIGSGPTVPDRTTFADALAVLAKYRIDAPAAVRAHLEKGAVGGLEETPRPGDPRMAHVETIVVATPQRSARGGQPPSPASAASKSSCWATISKARRVSSALSMHGRRSQHAKRVAKPTVILSGGETTVTVRGKGRGGRNVEYLSARPSKPTVRRASGAWRPTPTASTAPRISRAVFGLIRSARARAMGRDPKAMLDDNDGHSFFEMLGDSIVTGPTKTNVNDFRATLIARS